MFFSSSLWGLRHAMPLSTGHWSKLIQVPNIQALCQLHELWVQASENSQHQAMIDPTTKADACCFREKPSGTQAFQTPIMSWSSRCMTISAAWQQSIFQLSPLQSPQRGWRTGTSSMDHPKISLKCPIKMCQPLATFAIHVGMGQNMMTPTVPQNRIWGYLGFGVPKDSTHTQCRWKKQNPALLDVRICPHWNNTPKATWLLPSETAAASAAWCFGCYPSTNKLSKPSKESLT
jgi:hypothetical protein